MTDMPREDAVAKWFDAHGAALLLYARQLVGPAEADDCLQRVFVRLLTVSALPREPQRWLFRAVRNEAISIWRSTRRRGKREMLAAANAPTWFQLAPDDPLRAMEAQQALETLPNELREVVALRLWSGLTLTDIAEVLDVAVSTVHARYATAIETLRQKLEASCEKRKI
jgi:RNA polymerase sigma-70 factor (ECF subfamily)